MPEFGEITVSGLPAAGIRAGQFTLARGITPSILSLLIVPFDGLDLAETAVQFRFGNVSFGFSGCAIAAPFVRRRVNGRTLWSVHLFDRRWRWKFGTLSGEYNKRNPDGTLDTTSPNNSQTLQQLMGKCFDAMGESGYDLSRVPSTVKPYVKWSNINPALALANLCERTACEVVLNAQDAVSVWPSGQGDSTLDLTNLHPKYRYVPRIIPNQIEAIAGPSVWQTKLKLAAVGREGDFDQKKVNNLDYAPNGSWSTQSLLSFQGVTNSVSSALAMDTVWRQFRVAGQENGALPVPNCQETITTVDQYILQDDRLDAETDIDSFKRPLPAYVSGDYWPYSDLPNNVTDTPYIGQFKLLKERKLVYFDFPIVKLTSSGAYGEPTLYLNTAYQVRGQSGELSRVKETQNVGGAGGNLVIRVPEVFAGYRTSGNTEAQARQELREYLTLFSGKFNTNFASELTYAGLYPISPDGNIAQVSWRMAVGRAPVTMACERDELDRQSVGPLERKRREKLEAL